MDVLDGLSVVVEDIDPDHGLVELRVGTLDQLVVQMLLVVEGVEALEDEIEEGVEVLRAGRGHEDVGVAEAHGGGDGQPEGWWVLWIGIARCRDCSKDRLLLLLLQSVDLTSFYEAMRTKQLSAVLRIIFQSSLLKSPG